MTAALIGLGAGSGFALVVGLALLVRNAAKRADEARADDLLSTDDWMAIADAVQKPVDRSLRVVSGGAQ